MTKAILTDIEGTTTAVSFVYDVLFPYARQRMAAFVRSHRRDPQVQAQLREAEAELDGPAGEERTIEALLEWMRADRKVPALKALQGMIWRAGFESGALTGHLYPDAVEGLRRWHRQGIGLYVYSSGSVAAQRLLFTHSEFGDLTPLFSGYFDTRVGAKREPRSYRQIAEEIGHSAPEILFLSDTAGELDAAREAGMETIWLVRDAGPAAQPRHRQVTSFAEIAPR
jgi:enolase-phosphatase E1